MTSRKKRTTRNSKKSATKSSEQLCMTVTDRGATTSSCNAQNHFGYSPFDLRITVEPNINDLECQPLTVQLVFEDGQQIDTSNNKTNIQFTTNPSPLFINQQGQCQFTVKIDTYSMYHDNRAFKLVFNLSENATRHIRPCETKPFRLVKHRLEIVTEPDDTFYKDEGGRSNCLKCKILLKDSKKNIVKNRDIPLSAKLVYEDMSVAQSSRDILEILTQNVELKKGQCAVDFRINEVSKNHNKRAFRVLYECKSNDALYHDISSCVTNKITVKSKRTKKKTGGAKGGRGRGGNKNNNKKRKREIIKKQKQTSPYISTSSDGSYDLDDHDGMDSDDNMNPEPLRKKQRRNRGDRDIINISNNNNLHNSRNPYSTDFNPHLHSTLPSHVINGLNDLNADHTQYVPPALTGILPSIRPGALPRIGHQPPPFSNLSKKNNPITKTEKNSMSGGGVLGHMFSWCKLAGWVMNRLEWTHCGYEYDEATHSIDTRRPLYRCSYCLKYRNEAGWGNHEDWCQLKLALKEYETKVKTLYSEWNYQINSKDQGGMTTLDRHSSSPPPSIPNGGNNNNINNNKDKQLPSIHSSNNGPVISTGFSVQGNGGIIGSNNNNNNQSNTTLPAPFIVTPNQSNGTLWSFAYQSMGAPTTNVMGTNSMGFAQQSPQLMGYIPTNNLPPPQLISPNTNDNNNNINNNNPMSHKPFDLNNNNKRNKSPQNGGNVKHENMNNNVILPANMQKIYSVTRVRSQHGYDAYDKDNNFVGSFDDSGTFYDAEQFNDQYQPIFDQTQMLSRNQSDDYLFYNHIRNNTFGQPK